MKTMTTTGIDRAVRAAIDGGFLDAELARRFAEALDDAAMYMSIDAEDRGDRFALRRAARLLDLGDAIAIGCAQRAPQGA